MTSTATIHNPVVHISGRFGWRCCVEPLDASSGLVCKSLCFFSLEMDEIYRKWRSVMRTVGTRPVLLN